LRSLTPVGVIQELYGILLAHYAVRFLMHEAALTSDVDVDRLSFVHAVEVVRDAVPEFQMVAAAQQQLLYERMLQDIAAVRLPARRTRTNARVVKQKMSNFKLKRPQHYQPPKPRGTFRDAVVVQRDHGPPCSDPAEGESPCVLELAYASIQLNAARLDLRQPERCLI